MLEAEYKQGFVTLPLEVYHELTRQIVAANKRADELVVVEENYYKTMLTARLNMKTVMEIVAAKQATNPEWQQYVLKDDPYCWDFTVAELPPVVEEDIPAVE